MRVLVKVSIPPIQYTISHQRLSFTLSNSLTMINEAEKRRVKTHRQNAGRSFNFLLGCLI